MGELIGELLMHILDALRPTSRGGKIVWLILLFAGIALVIVAGVWR